MFRADLHCHTTMSDGTYTPQELLLSAKELGLNGLSITDHDTIEAYKTAPQIAKSLGLRLGSGAEFSCVFKGRNVHVLAYDFHLDDPHLLTLCERHKQRRTERNQGILERLARLGMPIFEEELKKGGTESIGRPHIAFLMLQKGYVQTLSEAFQLYIGDRCPCYVSVKEIPVEETLEIIHGAEGKAFIAHPHLLDKMSYIEELLKLPFDGLECYYARFPKNKESRWIKLAEKKRLLKSGGSDFHGKVKDYIPLGCSWVDEPTFNQIFQKPCN